MSFSNYTELQAAIASWMNRTDLGTEIVDFIALAEGKMNVGIDLPNGDLVQLRVREMLKTDIALLGTSDDDVTTSVHAIPSDYLEMKEYRPTGTWTGDDGAEVVTSADKLALERYSNIHVKNHTDAGGGQPSDYSDDDTCDNWNVWPLSGNWQMTASYYGEVPPLASNATTDVLTRYPDIYLFGALAEGDRFTGAQSDWGQRFVSAVMAANAQERRSQYSGATLRVQATYAGVRARQ